MLAAGRGTRMRSARPKVLHPLGGRPLAEYAVRAAATATGARPIAVVAPGLPEIVAMLSPLADCVEQSEARGTGDALRSVPVDRRSTGPVLVVNGDSPLVRAETMASVLTALDAGGRRSALVAVSPAPAGFGRLVLNGDREAVAVVEERDLPSGLAAPDDGNAGVYAFDGASLWSALDRLGTDNAAGEVYLTDVVALLGPATVVRVTDPEEAIGVNDRRDLAAAEAVLRRRTLLDLMLSGVTVEDPSTTYVDPSVRVGRDTVLRPMSVLRGRTAVGEGCEIGPMAQLRDVRTGNGVRIGASTLDDCVLEDDVVVGQYARVRPGSRLRRGVYLGTHAEIKNSDLGEGTHVSHFACVLDSDVGARVNVSAGVVTCNYDGLSKARVQLGDDVFVGSDAMLLAPLSVGDSAYIAAGSVVGSDVPAGALAVERGQLRTVEGWVERRRARASREGADR